MVRFRPVHAKAVFQRDRMQQLLERWLPAALLVLVALFQIYLAHSAHLSPWKGGGFGMFGTSDAPDMRVIQAEALDQDGNLLQFDVYSALDDWTIRRTRTLPRQSDLEKIAPQLVGQPVVPSTIQRQAIYYKLESNNPDFPAVQHAMQNNGSKSIANLPNHPLSQPLYRLKTVYDPEVPGAVKTLKAIRLQWWRIHFDQSHQRLWSEPLSPKIEAGVWQ